nr:helix-turn-helix transcriptional regulator [Plantibacter sp. CFBP 8775]
MTWVELVENRYVAADQPKVPGALGDLNDVQREIVDLVAAGYRNREIANQLHVSLRTVELRLTGVYRRLRIASRSQLIALSAAEGAPQVAASSAAAR